MRNSIPLSKFMKHKLTLLGLFSLIMILCGCATKKEIETKYVVLKTPYEFSKLCEVNFLPPKPETFAEMSAQDKEVALYDYATSLQNSLTACNIRLIRRSEWEANQVKNYQKE